MILFGYPTNGELSLNSRLYRYRQIEDGEEDDIRYYNRYFIQYEHGLFQPNELKNDLEEAELDLEESELEYQGDVVELIEDTTDDWLNLFENAYEAIIFEQAVGRLETAAGAAATLAQADPARSIDVDQIQIELANAREDLQGRRTSFRLQTANIKQDFQLPPEDSIVLTPVIDVQPVAVSVDQAITYARTLTPRLRDLEISRRMNEINLEQAEGRQSFRMDLELTYGREMQDPVFNNLWQEPTNSYTVSVSAYVPIWDWGQRRERIAASRISLEQNQLSMEQAEGDIVSDVTNEVRSLEEFESRAVAMESNLSLATQSAETALQRYGDGEIAALDLLRSLEREVETAQNFLDAYIGWREALLDLQTMTYWDFETDQHILERFGIGMPDELGGPIGVQSGSR